MSWVAASGWDTNETCEAGTSTIVALARFGHEPLRLPESDALFDHMASADGLTAQASIFRRAEVIQPLSGQSVTSIRLTTCTEGYALTAYRGEAEDLPQPVLQEFLDAVAVGQVVVPIDHVYGFEQIVEAHAVMEAGGAAGKLVVTTGGSGPTVQDRYETR